MPDRPKVLITGAAGRIGSFLTQQLAERYDFVLSDVRAPADRIRVGATTSAALNALVDDIRLDGVQMPPPSL